MIIFQIYMVTDTQAQIKPTQMQTAYHINRYTLNYNLIIYIPNSSTN